MNIITRRNLIATASLTAALGARLTAAEAGAKGRINHSVCKWCYPKVSVDELCKAGKEFGLTSVELVAPTDFPTLKQHGMMCAMTTFPTIEGPGGKKLRTIEPACNRVEHHDLLVKAYEPYIAAVPDARLKHL